MKVINLPQRSAQWLSFRDGKISGSKAKEYKKANPITKDDLLAFAESKGYEKIPKSTTIAKIREMLKPEKVDAIENTYDEYAKAGGNSYVSDVINVWREEYAKKAIKKRIVKPKED